MFYGDHKLFLVLEGFGFGAWGFCLSGSGAFDGLGPGGGSGVSSARSAKARI